MARIGDDTLELAIPGGKGEIRLPRAAIGTVAQSRGMESYRPSVSRGVFLLAPLAILATFSIQHPPHSNVLRAEQAALIGAQIPLVLSAFRPRQRERWEPIAYWVNR